MITRLFAPALLLAAGCFTWGTTPDRFPPAKGPVGAHVTVHVRGEQSERSGELLAVDSAGITIETQHVIRIAWSRIDAMDVARVGGDYDVHSGEYVTSAKVDRLKLLARFPQGIGRLPITLDSLISDASRETSRFADRGVAVADGYRRVGADFPGMGEHWVNVPMLLQNRIDPARPTLLTYADIAGRPTLLGIGFVIVTRGDTTPTSVPGWPTEWHEHSGLLSEESGAVIGTPRRDSPTHVWIMHVWTRLQNPAGQLTADNWSLPFVRVGVVAPSSVDADVGRAASLTTGGDEFLRDALTDAGLRTPANAGVVDSAISAAKVRASAKLLPNADAGALRDVWMELAMALERVLGPNAREIVRPAHSHGHEAAHP
jgi:hypothetical protein